MQKIKFSESSAKKLLFDGVESGCSSEESKENEAKKAYVPLYKRVAGRNDNTVFIPKAKNLYSAENFVKNLSLSKPIVIPEDQEKNWSKQLSRMIESIHADLHMTSEVESKPGAVKEDQMTFEQMLLSDDFFSFEAFSQMKKLSEMRQKRGRASYRQVITAQRSNQSESEYEFGKFDID